MPPQLLDQVAQLFALHPGADITTLSVPLESVSALLDPNVVKVAATADQRALYFSRAPIPWSRDSATAGLLSQRSCSGAHRHLGVYGYRVAALLRLASLPPSPLEQLEKLEQLRALEHGMDVRVARAGVPPGPDVNTADDLAVAAALLHSGP
jgi:3-deoxy-manno-octulosonate cytidylyltransferase (CMP-KDO synthetase)